MQVTVTGKLSQG